MGLAGVTLTVARAIGLVSMINCTSRVMSAIVMITINFFKGVF